MRRTKAVGGVTHYYTYDGLNLIREEWGNNTILFLYDASGSPIGMQYRKSSYAEGIWDTYYYEKNLQGDIIAIYNASGVKLANYTYDSWGRILSITNGNNQDVTNNASHIGNINPLRYRGYYYDDDLDLYYLATRYYDPEVCRFITADSYVSTGQGILGYNRYAYCGNNPVMRADPTGESWLALLLFTMVGGIASQAVVSTLSYAGMMVASLFDEDIRNDMLRIGRNMFNTSESATLESKKVSFYKGVPVFKFEHEDLTSFSFIAIFMNDEYGNDEDDLNHEYGHSIQQMLLGPLSYGIFVAFPSAYYCFTGDYINHPNPLHDKMYYSKVWERTADWLGGVDRDNYFDFWYIENFIFW